MTTQLNDKDPESMPGHVKQANYKSNLDPMAVLKRVEELRKWQEEEKMKLLKAHEDQMQQFRIEQVNPCPHTPISLAKSNRLNFKERLTKQISNDQQMPVPQRQTTFQHKTPKYSIYDDPYPDPCDLLNPTSSNKELQTSTDSGYTNSEGQFTTSNSSELTTLAKKAHPLHQPVQQHTANKPKYLTYFNF